ncbi:hypothetical protein [Pseudogulbenkiania ferrooxidans]|uniref:hypothetical protein n=1 Tax=Pseudogulbenkiania ferrooxidans TaxID=549169 RepID=UPI001237598D|nr:hypothetical protein [Pseudogulbenkiania ferrooxidans]
MITKLDLIARKLGLQGEGGPRPAPAPARQAPKLAALVRELNAVPAPRPAPTPAPARPKPRLTSIALKRNADGRIAAVSITASNGARHHLVAQRDQLGRINAFVTDDRTTWRVQRGFNGEPTGVVPIEEHDK